MSSNPRRRVSRVGLVFLVVLLVVGFAAPTIAAATQANEEPTASFTVSPDEPEPGQAVRLNASASSDPDGSIAAYRWDIDGDNETDLTGGPNRRVAFPSAGEYTITLTVEDNDGATATASKTIRVVGTEPPSAELSASPTEVTVGETTTLSPSGSSDPDGSIVEWAYDTDGDGEYEETFDSPTDLRTNFAEAGTVEVTLRVTDNDGMTDTATVEITVERAATTTTDGTDAEPVTTAGVVTTVVAPPSGGGLWASINGALPGGSLAAIAILIGVLVLLVLAGYTLYSSSALGGGAAGGAGTHASTDGSWKLGYVLGVLLVVILTAVPLAAIRNRVVPPTGQGFELALALVQLAALLLPALLLLLYLPIQLSGGLGRNTGTPVDALSPLALQTVVLGVGLLASILVVVALGTVLIALQLPLAIAIAGYALLGAIWLIPVALAITLVYLLTG